MKMQLYAMIKQSKLILMMHFHIIIKEILYNTIRLINMWIANLKKYEDAIICYDKAIQINPNYAFAYNNKGICLQVQKGINISIRSLKKYEDTIICYDKAIQIDPNYVNAYINKGDSLKYKSMYIKVTILKKNKLAIENYEMAIKYCSTDEKEFLNRIQQIKNSQ